MLVASIYDEVVVDEDDDDDFITKPPIELDFQKKKKKRNIKLIDEAHRANKMQKENYICIEMKKKN